MTQTIDIKEATLSPMMQQWKLLKEQAKEAILLFRLGDFYEAFFEDAKILSEVVDVVLTQRQNIPMSGIPYHQLDPYLEKLIEKQYIVAIAEQVEAKEETKGLVKREIVEIVSPATFINGKRGQTNYYFASLFQINTTFGIAFLELSTGEFITFEVDQLKGIIDEMAKLRPVEILVSPKFEKKHGAVLAELKNLFSFRLTIAHESRFEPTLAQETLAKQFGSQSLNGFGLIGHPAAITASGALLKYLKVDLCRNTQHLVSIHYRSQQKYVKIDHSTLFHLDILQINKDRLSLQKAIDYTLTPMGSRTLEFYLTHPLLDIQEIQKRQTTVSALLTKQFYQLVREHLYSIKDIQRIAKKIELDILQPKEAFTLKTALCSTILLYHLLKQKKLHESFPNIAAIEQLNEVIQLLEKSLIDPPPTKLGTGRLIRTGFNSSLDELYEFKTSSETFLESYQNSLRDQLGIKTLKVGYSRAFGYFIEVSRGQAQSMPQSFERLQTLVNAERFITKELKEYEVKIATCETQIAQLEESTYQEIKNQLKQFSIPISELAKEIGHLDVLCSFAKISDEYGYICPTVDDSFDLEIEEGKHPILAIKTSLEPFIPNDTHFSDSKKMLLITGPNMAGKSTYIRQNALLVLLAQIGCFVPAKKMRLGFCDQIFSRIGASDDLNRGLSTFMVEMSETANILHHATARSLIILDEIGRGTSTYDGIAIASAVAEFLVAKRELSPKTLFATHYFELTKLEEKFKEIKNYHVAIHEKGDDVIFLRKILPGILDKSFGIHVAKLAGIPHTVIQRAKTLLKELETEKPKKPQEQFSLFENPKDLKAAYLKEQIIELQVDSLSPKEALAYLYQLKEELTNL
jgi:DNA mismatch repair protein MutS